MASKAGVTRWKGAAITIAIGIAVVVAMSKAHKRSNILNSADLKVSDVRIYYKSSARPTGVVVIAQIDDKSIAELGGRPTRGYRAAARARGCQSTHYSDYARNE